MRPTLLPPFFPPTAHSSSAQQLPRPTSPSPLSPSRRQVGPTYQVCLPPPVPQSFSPSSMAMAEPHPPLPSALPAPQPLAPIPLPPPAGFNAPAPHPCPLVSRNGRPSYIAINGAGRPPTPRHSLTVPFPLPPPPYIRRPELPLHPHHLPVLSSLPQRRHTEGPPEHRPLAGAPPGSTSSALLPPIQVPR
jgi:hypothetical protein